MTTRLLITFIGGLIAAPSFAGPATVDPTLASAQQRMPQAKITVRNDWAARFQDERRGPETTDRFTRTVRLGRTGTFELSNVSGNVVVTGGNGDDVRIEAVKRVRARGGESDAKSLLDEMRIEVTELPNRVEVRTIYPQNRRNYSGSVDYTIAMPAGANATVKTVSGDVRVTNVKGELRTESVSGNVVTTGAARLSYVKSVSGNIEVSDAAGDPTLSISAVSGNINIRALKTRALELNSVSGDVTATNVTCERATAKTVSGNVEYEGPLVKAGRYEMGAHSGNVRIIVTATTGFELEATTFNGDVRSDFPLTLRAGMDEGTGSRRRPFNRSIRGSYGDAGAIVNVKSFSGDIVVTKK